MSPDGRFLHPILWCSARLHLTSDHPTSLRGNRPRMSNGIPSVAKGDAPPRVATRDGTCQRRCKHANTCSGTTAQEPVGNQSKEELKKKFSNSDFRQSASPTRERTFVLTPHIPHCIGTRQSQAPPCTATILSQFFLSEETCEQLLQRARLCAARQLKTALPTNFVMPPHNINTVSDTSSDVLDTI